MYRSRHLFNPFIHQSIHPFYPRLKSGKTGSNQKWTFGASNLLDMGRVAGAGVFIAKSKFDPGRGSVG